MENAIAVHGPSYALEDFNALASQAGIPIRPREPAFPPGTPIASIFGFEILHSPEAKGIAVLIAGVICAYLKAGAARKITINIREDGRIKALDARAYSPDQIATIIRDCQGLVVFDEKPKETKARKEVADIPGRAKKADRKK